MASDIFFFTIILMLVISIIIFLIWYFLGKQKVIIEEWREKCVANCTNYLLKNICINECDYKINITFLKQICEEKCIPNLIAKNV